MPIVDRPVEDEPEERPDQLGRHLIKIKLSYPDQWRDVYETTNRGTATRIEGCLIGRGDGRIAGASETDHWEARLIEKTEVDEKGVERKVYTVRAKYHTEPHGKDWRRKAKPAAKPKDEPTIDETVGTTADHPETARVSGQRGRAADVGPTTNAPRDPEEAAQAGLDLAAG